MYQILTLTFLACVILANLTFAIPQRNPLEGVADVLNVLSPLQDLESTLALPGTRPNSFIKRSKLAREERMSTLDIFYGHLEQCKNDSQPKVQTNNQQCDQVNQTNSQLVALRLESNLRELNDDMLATLDKMNSSFISREIAPHISQPHQHTMVEFCELMIHFMSNIQGMYIQIHQTSISHPIVQIQCQDQMQQMSTSLNNIVEKCIPIQGFNTQILATAQKSNHFFSLAEKTPFGFSDFMQNLQ
ncbi:hypothetical protein DFH28DRAFT_31064 [Melampsora americana]|nr:hypothetical protein DFH28DRAFT_31064 [Melampsora americana]